jgi:multiple sugar transport system ATP-binding protein
MAAVTLDKVSKVYENGHVGVRDLDLEIADGEFLVLVGPSGCGKSTALRMVAGLEDISSGTMRIGEKVVNDLPPKDRDVAMVFQNYALYPHMTVADNIGFALKLAGMRKDEIRKRVAEAARTLQIEEWLQRKPGQLSGGQRQRVAMGRAIVRDPAVFLMDEPLSNLDAKLRVQMRAEIAALQRDLKTTTIYVTHDQVEAMTMGDRVAVMREGLLQQIDAPEVLYARPDNLFVAAFIGSPSMNLLEGVLELGGGGGDALAKDGGGATLVLGTQRLPLPGSVLAERAALRSYAGKPVVVGLRPETLSDAALRTDLASNGANLQAEVELRESLGSEVLLHLRVDGAKPAITRDVKQVAGDVDDAAIEALERQAHQGQASVVARFDPASKARVGDSVQVAVDLRNVHLFDPDTGAAIRD